MEPPNNGHIEDECSEVVPFSEIEMYGQYDRQGVNSLSIVGQTSSSIVHKHCMGSVCKSKLFSQNLHCLFR